MNLSRFTDFFLKNKKAIFVLISAFLVLSPDFAFAEGALDFKDIFNFVVSILQFIAIIFTAFAGLLTMIISWFLSPEWTTGSLFGINGYLKEIWILVSNVVYFVFAFILIWIAFMNILGKGDKWELKQALPKFTVGVLIVPFSWFFVQFVVSITSILTVSVLTLPNEVFQNYTANLDKNIMCSEYVIDYKNIDSIGGDMTAANAKKVAEGIFHCNSSGEDVSVRDILENNSLGIMNVYTYGVMNVDKIDNLTETSFESGVKSIATLLEKGLFDIIFAAVYFILLITLAIALLVRGIWLWLYMMLSPVFGLLYFFDKNEGGGSFDHFNIKEFFALAMVPVYVAAALSFGLLFLSVVSKGMSETTDSMNQIVSFNFGTGEDKKDASISIGQDRGKITLVMKGGGQEVVEGGGDYANHILGAGKGMIGMMIMQIFGIVILWMAVMAAFKASKITNTVTEPIQQFGNQVGQLMAKSPTYAPIFPGGQSMAGMSTVAGKVQSHFDSKQVDKASKFVGTYMPFADQQSVAKTSSMEKIINKINNHEGHGPKWQAGLLKDILKEMGDVNSIIANKNSHEAIRKLAAEAGLKKDDIDNFKFDTRDQVAEALRKVEGKIEGDGGGSVFRGKNDTTFNGNELDKFMRGLSSGDSSYDGGEGVKSYYEEVGDSSEGRKFKLNIGSNITVKTDGSLSDTDAKDFVRFLQTNSLVQSLNEEQFRKRVLEGMSLYTKEEQDKLLSSITKYIKPDGGSDWEGKQSTEIQDLFKKDE